MADKNQPLPTAPGLGERIRATEQQLKALYERQQSLLGVVKAAYPDDQSLAALGRDFAEAHGQALGELAAVADGLQSFEQSYATMERARNAAEEVIRSRAQLLAGASHDLLQPLGATRLFLSTLNSAQLRPQNRNLVERANKALCSAELLLGSLLEISEMDARRIQPEMTNFPISSLFTTLENEFEPIAARKGLKLSVVVSTTRVLSDLAMLRRILQNLVSNAVHYTDRGKLLLGCRRRRQGLRIEVWDTGCGIASSEFDKIFQEFYRVQPRTESDGVHVGMGLSIVYRLAQTLEHQLSVCSQPGRGSCFAVTVPYGRAMPALRPDDIAPRPRPLARPLSNICVVLVENDPGMLQAMTAQLAQWSCQVMSACTPKDATDMLRQSKQRPDLMIVDQHLGQPQTGLELVSQIRAQQGAAVPAILITADKSSELKQAAELARCQFLVKPFEPAVLHALICKLLE